MAALRHPGGGRSVYGAAKELRDRKGAEAPLTAGRNLLHAAELASTIRAPASACTCRRHCRRSSRVFWQRLRERRRASNQQCTRRRLKSLPDNDVGIPMRADWRTIPLVAAMMIVAAGMHGQQASLPDAPRAQNAAPSQASAAQSRRQRRQPQRPRRAAPAPAVFRRSIAAQADGARARRRCFRSAPQNAATAVERGADTVGARGGSARAGARGIAGNRRDAKGQIGGCSGRGGAAGDVPRGGARGGCGVHRRGQAWALRSQSEAK